MLQNYVQSGCWGAYNKLGVGAWLLTDLFCWFPWAGNSGFGSLKLGTSEYTMQNLWRQNPCFNITVSLHKLCLVAMEVWNRLVGTFFFKIVNTDNLLTTGDFSLNCKSQRLWCLQIKSCICWGGQWNFTWLTIWSPLNYVTKCFHDRKKKSCACEEKWQPQSQHGQEIYQSINGFVASYSLSNLL